MTAGEIFFWYVAAMVLLVIAVILFAKWGYL